MGNFYRPPNEGIKECINSLKTSLKSLREKDEVYLLGDLNINMANTNCTATKDFNWFLQSHNMMQHIKTSTRVAETSRTILDLIISTKFGKIQEVSTILSTVSDHYPIYINIKKSKTASHDPIGHGSTPN